MDEVKKEIIYKLKNEVIKIIDQLSLTIKDYPWDKLSDNDSRQSLNYIYTEIDDLINKIKDNNREDEKINKIIEIFLPYMIHYSL